jgi:hypothetical protein
MSTRLASLVRSLAAVLLLSLTLVRPAAAVDYTDIWWNSLESGWGVNFVQADNFVFATFFIYGPNNQPIWYTGNMTVDANGVWSGPLYFTSAASGTYFGNPWNPSGFTQPQVGTVTFTPANSYSGTLTYNVGTVTVTKQITRQTLKTIPAAGDYSGAVLSVFSNCTDPNNNGPLTYFANLTVVQTTGGPLQFDFTNSDGPFRIVGTYIQDGQLYRIPNATYTVGSFTFTAQVSEVKVTSQGIEGRWTAPVGAAFAGCTENAFFSFLFVS